MITNTTTIKLTHPRICDFYTRNPTISPETVNLAWIDMYEATHSTSTAISSELPTVPPDPHIDTFAKFPNGGSPSSANSGYKKHIIEMKELLVQFTDILSRTNTHISQEYIFSKSEYINEFRSLWSQSCCVSRRDSLLENNRKLIHFIEQLTYDIRNIKRIHSHIGEKTDTIIKQFHKIIHNNIETILTKPSDIESMVNEFLHNFEINSSHMIVTIQQLITDFATSKEQAVLKIEEMFSTNGETAITAYCKFVYEIKNILAILNASKISSLSSDTNPNMVSLLSRLYNTGYIQPDENDLSVYVLSRDDKPTICIQQLQIKDRNVNTDEIAHFLQMTKEKNVHGILVSQYTGITSKPNLYIDINHNRVYIYVHSMEYSPEKLQTAIDIVDTISAKLTDFNNSPDQKYTVPKEVLDEINREYQMFISQKETIVNTVKDTYKKLISQIEDLRFGTLDKYLSTRYSYFKKQGYICNLCNVFSVSTLKGLAAHKRGCNRKITSTESKPSTLVEKNTKTDYVGIPLVSSTETSLELVSKEFTGTLIT